MAITAASVKELRERTGAGMKRQLKSRLLKKHQLKKLNLLKQRSLVKQRLTQ